MYNAEHYTGDQGFTEEIIKHDKCGQGPRDSGASASSLWRHALVFSSLQYAEFQGN